MLAAACGLIAANVYYAQPLAGAIGTAIGLSPGATGLVVTLTQIGYGAGLLLIVPLGDLIENRLLVTSMVGVTCIAAAWSSNAALFLPSVLLVGVGAVAVQILIPYASHLVAPGNTRNYCRQCDQRPHGGRHAVAPGFELDRVLVELANRLSDIGSRHVLFGDRVGCATASADSGVESDLSSAPGLDERAGAELQDFYGSERSTSVFSMGRSACSGPRYPCRSRAPPFTFPRVGVALFALLGGGGGILAAPIGGRLADRGWTRGATAGAMIAVAIGFLLTLVPIESSTVAFCLLVVAAKVPVFGR